MAYDSRGTQIHALLPVDGRKVVATAGVAEAFSVTLLIVTEITITAERDNGGFIAVGASTVVAAEGSERGDVLGPGDSVTVEAIDLATLYLNATVSGDGVTYFYQH